MTIEEQLQSSKDRLDLWAKGGLSFTNLGPREPYTPDVIAIMDAQEVVKASAEIVALCAIIAVREARGQFG